MLEIIFITSAIDAKEERDIAIMDLPGAFLHAYNDEKVVMFMKGKMAELMVHIAHKNTKDIWHVAKCTVIL